MATPACPARRQQKKRENEAISSFIFNNFIENEPTGKARPGG